MCLLTNLLTSHGDSSLLCCAVRVSAVCVRTQESKCSDVSLQIAGRDLNVASQQTKMNVNYFNYSSEAIFKVTCSF